ncbi:MAG: hypothetical protein L3K23_10460 [Thermoplasmata archaeon]|nr:hypothetical protein [Thermoplasmata archaeon]
MSPHRPTVIFDPDGFEYRAWFNDEGQLFAERFQLSMGLPKGGVKWVNWAVWRAPSVVPNTGDPFLLYLDSGALA